MIVKKTPWEKRNLGVESSVEFYIGQNESVNIIKNSDQPSIKHLVERIPTEDYTSVDFGKGSNNTILLLAKQVAEDIGQSVVME